MDIPVDGFPCKEDIIIEQVRDIMGGIGGEFILSFSELDGLEMTVNCITAYQANAIISNRTISEEFE